MATPALAGKSTPTPAGGSTIAIGSIDGTVVSAAATSPAPKLGDTLTFRTTVGGLSGGEYPMVAVSCYQDVNGDKIVDTGLLGPDIVFSQLGTPSATFMLGGYSSIWLNRGGSAVCRGDLYAYSWKGGKESTRVLATTGSWLAAG
jgi:hypothetical protein